MIMILKLFPKIINHKFLPNPSYDYQPAARLIYRGELRMGIFKKRANFEQIITLEIKNAKNGVQIDQIIKKKQRLFNIVHLTAILDRVEELDLLEKKKFVQYVVQQLKKISHFFSSLTTQKVRTISNLICYLGNMQNQQMNDIFQKINYHFMFKNANKTQIVMLITGLMRLKLFENIFDIDTNGEMARKNKIAMERVISSQFQFYQILSIWYAFLTKISSTNIRINNHFNNILDQIKSLQVDTIERYTYLVVCFIKAYENHSQKNLIKLSHAVFNHSFKYELNRKYCTPYQLSLLLAHMKQAQSIYAKSNASADGIINSHSGQFWVQNKNELMNILQQNFIVICNNPHVTLRNIANCIKFYYDLFPINQTILTHAYYVFIKILQKQFKRKDKNLPSGDNDQMGLEARIDFLSFCSLIYSFSEDINLEDKSLKYDVNVFISLISCYLKQLNKSSKLYQYQNKQILLLYSSLYRLTKRYEVEYDSEVQSISIDEVTSSKRVFSLKEITFIYTYFKKIHFVNPKFCQWLRRQIVKKKVLNETQLESIRVAKQIMSLKKCLSKNSENCNHCFEHEQAKFFRKQNNEINVKNDAIK